MELVGRALSVARRMDRADRAARAGSCRRARSLGRLGFDARGDAGAADGADHTPSGTHPYRLRPRSQPAASCDDGINSSAKQSSRRRPSSNRGSAPSRRRSPRPSASNAVPDCPSRAASCGERLPSRNWKSRIGSRESESRVGICWCLLIIAPRAARASRGRPGGRSRRSPCRSRRG